MLKLMLILALGIGCIQYATAVCNVCNELNGVACISEKEFHPCFSNIPDTSVTLSCLGEFDICTRFGQACMNKNTANVLPACGDTSNCGKCGKEEKDNGMFACTSRTTFTMCFGGELSDIRVTCPENQICDVKLGKQKKTPCVPSCKETEIEFCDLNHPIDVPVTTTPEPITTTEIPITTTSEKDTTTTTDEVITTTTPKPITTTTEEITTTIIFAPTPPEVLTTTTEEPINTTQVPPELVCSQQTETGRYPYPNDPTCQNYIYCYKKGGVMQTTFMKCPPQHYFNTSTRLCAEEKPEGCI